MIVKTFPQLTENEKNLLYDTLSQRKMFQNLLDMFLYMTHAHFRFGNETYIWLNKEKIVGVMSVISKHTTKTGELCIPLFYFDPNIEVELRSILDTIWNLYSELTPKFMKLGIRSEDVYISQMLIQEGIHPVDRVIVFTKSLSNSNLGIKEKDEIALIPLQPSMYDLFITIYNEAFEEDPHVHPIDRSHLEEILTKYESTQNIGLVQHHENTIGVYEIEMRETEDGENYGWIETIALAPSVRGQGIGNMLLTKLIAKLADEGAKSVRLRTYENNASAVTLYEKNGFTKHSLQSIWHLYKREDVKTAPVSRRVRRPNKRI